MASRSFWAWGMESDEPSPAEVRTAAARVSALFDHPVEPAPPPDLDRLRLREPRISPPSGLAEIFSSDRHDRARHSYGRSFPDRVHAFRGEFPAPPDLIARPWNEAEIEAVLDWCGGAGYAVIPYGGGSSVVGGVNPPPDGDGAITLDLERFDRVTEVDLISRAARIQSGALGPAIESQLRPHGLTLRHYPQSFEYSTLGGWIATRSAGHYATNHTRVDDFVESVRMVTPSGLWESRRLPGSGAGPAPDRLVLGSEGILGVITEAWMRVQARPEHRVSAGVTFASFEAGYEAARLIARAKLWPANLRLLDPQEAAAAAGVVGEQALLVVGFESADAPQDELASQALEIARNAGGEVQYPDGGGPVQEWRESFIRAPYVANATVALGLVHDTFETAITWDRWPEMDVAVCDAVRKALSKVCGAGTVTRRFTHVYPDGPAPYYTFMGPGRPGGEVEMWEEIKQAASDAVMAAGGTITHHHAVGRLHRPWYDEERPAPFARALEAAKRAVDPAGVLNPGVLIDTP